MREKFDTEYLRDVIIKVAAGIFGILLLVYFGFQIWNRFTSFAEYEYAKPCTVGIKETGTGYIFRAETVIPASCEGSVVSSVASGERVSKESEVAGIYSSSNQTTEARLEELSKQISLFSSMGDECENLTTRDVSKLDDEIYSVMTNIKTGTEDGDYSDAVSHRITLLSKINRRSIASGGSNGFSAGLAALENEKNILKGNLGGLLETVYTPLAGWYYPEVDGYESVMTVGELKNLTYERFGELVGTSPASTNGSAGKIVTDNKWYFVCELSNSRLENMELDEEYTLYFPYNGDVKLQLVLTHAANGKGDMGVAVFSCERMPEGFDFLRMQNYELLTESYTGFKVPKNAVRVVDGMKGVYVITGEMAHFRKIDILCEYESSYIVAMEHSEKEGADSGSSKETTSETTAETVSEETSAESAKNSDGEDSKAEEKVTYEWLGLNEKIIVNGKGLKEGKIIRVDK